MLVLHYCPNIGDFLKSSSSPISLAHLWETPLAGIDQTKCGVNATPKNDTLKVIACNLSSANRKLSRWVGFSLEKTGKTTNKRVKMAISHTWGFFLS